MRRRIEGILKKTGPLPVGNLQGFTGTGNPPLWDLGILALWFFLLYLRFLLLIPSHRGRRPHPIKVLRTFLEASSEESFQQRLPQNGRFESISLNLLRYVVGSLQDYSFVVIRVIRGAFFLNRSHDA